MHGQVVVQKSCTSKLCTNLPLACYTLRTFLSLPCPPLYIGFFGVVSINNMLFLFYHVYIWGSDNLDNNLSVMILHMTCSQLIGQVPSPCFICFTWGRVCDRPRVFSDILFSPLQHLHRSLVLHILHLHVLNNKDHSGFS